MRARKVTEHQANQASTAPARKARQCYRSSRTVSCQAALGGRWRDRSTQAGRRELQGEHHAARCLAAPLSSPSTLLG